MPNLSVSYDPPVARLVLDRPARRNAITAAMWTHLPSLCAEIESHSQIKAVIVEGAGDYFSSGAEITEFDRTFSDIDSARAYLGAIENALLALSRTRPADIGENARRCDRRRVGGSVGVRSPTCGR